MDADLAVDDEFHTCQADAFARQVGEAECEFGVADVHHHFNRRFRHIVQGNVGDLYVQQAGVDKAGIAFGTGYGNFLTVAQQFGCVAAADYGRNTQFARDDGGVAGTAAAVGNDSGSAFHYRLPIRVGHVGNEYVASFHGIHFGGVFHQADFALTDFLTDGAAFAQYGFVAVDVEAAQVAAAFFLGFHGFRTGLQDVEFAVQAVTAPFDIHRAAVVFFDCQRVVCQLGDFFVGNGEAVAVFFGNIDVHYGFTGFCFVGKDHFDLFRTHGFAQDGRFACFQRGFENIEFVRVDRALYDVFTQTVR